MNTIIDKTHAFLRKLSNIMNNALNEQKEAIDSGEIEVFVQILAKAMFEAVSKGLVSLDHKAVKFNGTYTKEYFITGVTLLREGIDSNAVIIALECLSTVIFKTASDITATEILEIKILEKVLPMIQQGDIKSFFDTIRIFCSGITTGKLGGMYKDYIDT